jgi:hypothetical protein
MDDFLTLILKHHAENGAAAAEEWSVVLVGGEKLTGKIEHLGGTAYVVKGVSDSYFNSTHAVRLSPYDPNGIFAK